MAPPSKRDSYLVHLGGGVWETGTAFSNQRSNSANSSEMAPHTNPPTKRLDAHPGEPRPVSVWVPPPTSSFQRPSGVTSSENAPRMQPPSDMLDAGLASLATSFSTDGVVTLIIGENEQKMTAHGSHLTRNSPFFAAAMKKDWAEGQTRTIKLPDECPANMAHYLSFLYGGRLLTQSILSGVESQIKPGYQILAALYVCGERFLNRYLQSAIVREILRLTRLYDGLKYKYHYPIGKPMNTIYRGTPKRSLGRRLLVDLHVSKGVQE